MKLSKRLELLAYLVEKHKKGNILADIGMTIIIMMIMKMSAASVI